MADHISQSFIRTAHIADVDIRVSAERVSDGFGIHTVVAAAGAGETMLAFLQWLQALDQRLGFCNRHSFSDVYSIMLPPVLDDLPRLPIVFASRRGL